MEDKNLLKRILDCTNETQTSLAEKLDTHRQYINQICKGKRKISFNMREKLKSFYPMYFEEVPIPEELTSSSIAEYRVAIGYSYEKFAEKLKVSSSLIRHIEDGTRPVSKRFKLAFRTYIGNPSSSLITLKYDSLNTLNANFIPNDINSIDCEVKVDKKLLPNQLGYMLRVITLKDDALSPMFNIDDKVVFDESQKKFLDGSISVFRYMNQTYIRKISVLPNKIKCIALNKEYDTFYFAIGDATLYGNILPRIRF